MSDETELLQELRALARATDGDKFTVTLEGVPVDIAYTGGSSSSLTLSAPYRQYLPGTGAVAAGYRTWARPPRAPRPLDITLRRETSGDVRTKSKGIDREVQTWDPDFDRDVYIDTLAPDEAVSFVLSQPEARAAIRALLVEEGLSRLVVDDTDGRVTATLVTFTEKTPRPGRGARLAHHFATMVRHLPLVEEHGDKPKDRGAFVIAGLSAVAGVGFLAQLFGSFALAPAGCVTHDDEGTSLSCIEVQGQNCCTPMGVGLVTGVPLGLVLGWLASRPFRGTSRSSSRMSMVIVMVIAITTELTSFLAELLMWP